MQGGSLLGVHEIRHVAAEKRRLRLGLEQAQRSGVRQRHGAASDGQGCYRKIP